MTTDKGILIVGTFLSGAGQNPSYCEALADRLEHSGWAVTRTSTKLHRLARVREMLETAWRRREAYSIALVDVFSGTAFAWAEAVCFLLRLLRKPYVLALRGGALPEFAARAPRRVHRLLRTAQAVVAPSEYMRQRMRPYHAEIEVVPNAVDVRGYDATARRSVGAKLLWVRAFHSIYNPCLAVDVIAQLASQFDDVSLTMIGPDKADGTHEAVLRRIESSGMADRVRLHGRIEKSDLPRYFADSDIFLNTTDVDNTPVSVLEAMAAGMCVVSTNVGGIPFLLAHEVTAMLVPPRDAVAMAAAVERILRERELASELSRNGRAFAATCAWELVLARWSNVLGKARA